MKAFWQSVRVIPRSSAAVAFKQIQRHFGIGGVMEAEKARNAAREKQIMVEKQGDTVRAMKAAKLPQEEIDKAINDLKHLKLELQELQAKLSDEGEAGTLSKEAFRQAVNNTLERRLFYIPSFKIYRGVAGLYDYGPPGCAVKANVIAYWRQHFALEENMLEVDCPCVTPEEVLKASGHVDKFTDLMVKDEKTGMCYRADHLLKDYCKEKLEKDPLLPVEKVNELKQVLAVLDELSAEALGQKIKEYGITAPETKNPLSDPYPFNLMFATSIGPSGASPGYLRPETAQGIFVNFKDLYYYNGNKLPFAAAQIGQAFRNEISPRQGLLRVREFTLAEIEHFVNPDDKSHPKFKNVADLEFLIYSREEQMALKPPVKLRLGDAVAKGSINNETLGYFIGRTFLFLTTLGIDKERLRFRQHLQNEMAHYACDCWDAEIECSYGWIECVGLADRSAYDLKAHTEKSGVPLVAHETYAEPKEVEKLVITPAKRELGLAFKKNQRMIVEALEAMNEAEAMDLKARLESEGQAPFEVCTLGQTVTLTKDMVSISKEIKKEHQRIFTPSVIEPSFGIGRIIYCLFEHCFYTRSNKSGDEQLNVFRFPPLIAPIKCTVFHPRLRNGPVSPVRVNFQQENWVQPSNADVEYTQKPSLRGELVDRTLLPLPSPPETAPPPPPHGLRSEPRSFPEFQDDSRGAEGGSEPQLERTNIAEPTKTTPTDRVRNQDQYRNSRESNETASTNPQQISIESSATTSASSLSGMNENVEGQAIGDSPESSIIEGNMPETQPVPLFQYHHQKDFPTSVPSAEARNSSASDLAESASNIGRHLTPNSGSHMRTSLPRPPSSYSVYSDSRGRSPGLLPAGSRKSPDARMSTYAELLHAPYPQQAPAPLTPDNSNLRTVIGNNASLLSTQKTLDMYRANVKKTNDSSIQYSFAIFLISTAQEQGLDFSEPKARKNSPKPQKGRDSPTAEGSVSSPQELVREARQILQRLASAGYPFAQYYLADGFASGLFSKGKEDYNSAFPLFVLAAKHGHAESGYRTALCYEFGWGCRKDPAKAVQFLRTAASKRHPGAMTRLGKACLSGDLGEKRYREGIKWMKLAAEAADTQYNSAPYQLGCLYENGYGADIFKDDIHAAELFTQAAELGHPEANYRLGDAYEHGLLNCPRDPALSVHFYTGAAERGHAGAMMGLCAWYMVGAPPILEKDEEEAYEWARRSADLGFVKAQYAVGYFTEMGIGCRRDVLEANVWYVKAADAGEERAKQRLAIIQAAVSGQGTPMEVAPPRNGKMQKNPKDDKDCIVM